MNKYSFTLVLGLTFMVGMAWGFLNINKSLLIAVIFSLAVIWFLVWFKRDKSQKPEDPGAWQRLIDAEYRLEIHGSTVTLYRHDEQVTQFEWLNVIEIQHLRRKGDFPPLFWKIITEDGEFLIPNGGSYARTFEEQSIYALPGYYDQRVASIPAPEGYIHAMSMWRKDDPYPKRERSDDDCDW